MLKSLENQPAIFVKLCSQAKNYLFGSLLKMSFSYVYTTVSEVPFKKTFSNVK